jgi:hypothetical protein
MANLKVKDQTGTLVYLKATGAGSDVDPNITETLETNSAAIKTALELIDNPMQVLGGGTESGALRVTVASDSTGVLPITGTVTANLSATDNTVLDNIDTSLNNIEAAVSGTEMQVDVATIHSR